jgi:hypothetical protein
MSLLGQKSSFKISKSQQPGLEITIRHGHGHGHGIFILATYLEGT